MPPLDSARSGELEASRDSRVAARRLNVQERYLALLRLARRVRLDNRFAAADLAALITQGEIELQNLRAAAGGRIVPRRRPTDPGKNPTDTCTVFIDECGQHSLKGNDAFGAFVLAAVIIRDSGYAKLDHEWREWKRNDLGAETKIVHEPDVRNGRGAFYFEGDKERRRQATDSLATLIPALAFSAVAVVTDRKRYKAEFGLDALGTCQ